MPSRSQLELLATSLVSYAIVHKYEPNSLKGLLSIFVAAPAMLIWHNKSPISSTLFSYWGLISAYTLLYRISPWHPLSKIPGPFINKLSKFVMIPVVFQGEKHRYLQKLHRKYGDIVRTGPNEISYAHVDGLEPILGMNGLPKGPYYHYSHGDPSLLHIRNPAEYGPRRRLWNNAMSTTATKYYDEKILGRVHELVEVFEKSKGKKMDLSAWMEYFALDAMGDMVFTFPFDQMKAGCDAKGYHETIIGSVQSIIFISEMPWLVHIITKFVDSAGHLLEITKSMVQRRQEVGSTAKDLFYHLNDEDDKLPTNKSSQSRLFDECFVAIIAGSDTSSTVMASVWHYLLQNPEKYARFQQEIDEAFPSGVEPSDMQKLAALPYLNACINEALRLQPPVPSGSPRWVPPGSTGVTIGNQFIPEGTAVTLHTYTIHRDARNFTNPDVFYPERWLPESTPEAHNPGAMFPFSWGVRVCPGKAIGMTELRLVLAALSQKFKFTAAQDLKDNAWEKTLKDVFVIKKGALNVEIAER